MTALDTFKQVQVLLGLTGPDVDGLNGSRTRNAFEALGAAALAEWHATKAPDAPGQPIGTNKIHRVIASSFADPADVAKFHRCKARGGSDEDCFKVGDNGIGKWGDDCTEGSGPRCALPPEEWEQFGPQARGKLVIVTANGATVVCELRDTMPHYAHITNGAGIDLNPDAVRALGMEPPIMVSATWQWA